MNCEYIWSGLFEFKSPGAAFRHDLDQFALWSSAIWAVWLLIPVIGTWELNWFGSSDFTEQSFCCLSARWDSFNCFIWCCLVGRLDEEPESGGVWLLFWISSVFPCFFVGVLYHTTVKFAHFSLFSPYASWSLPCLLCLSCAYPDLLSLSQIVEFAITKNWVQYSTVPRIYIWLIVCFLQHHSWVNEFYWSQLHFYSNSISFNFSWFDMGPIRKPVAHQFLSKKQAHYFSPAFPCWFDQSVLLS